MPEVQQKIVITHIRSAVKVLQAVEEFLEQEIKGMTSPSLMEGMLKIVKALREQYVMVRNREQAFGHWSDGSRIDAIYAIPLHTEEHRTLMRELSVAQGFVIAQANVLQYLLEPSVVEDLVRSG